MDKVQLDELIATDYKNLISIAKIKNKYKTSYERIKRVSIERNIWNPEGRTFYMKKHCKDHLRSVKENPFQGAQLLMTPSVLWSICLRMGRVPCGLHF